GSVVARVAFGGGDDARRAIDAAEEAMRTPVPAHERAAVLDRVAAIVRERREEFAQTIAREAGKPIATAQVEVDRCVQTVPLSALLLAQAFADAGQPAGWLNVIVGRSGEIGDVLSEDPRVRLITFTGSSAVGWRLRERAARKKVSLELGNSTPMIVLADADL